MRYFKKNILLIILLNIIFSIDISILDNSDDWIIIQNKNINIAYKEINKQPYCKANMIYEYSISDIKKILENRNLYPTIFKRIMFCNSINKNTVHMGIKLPFPFSPRDYIVEYQYYNKNNKEYYIYESKKNLSIKKNNDFIRLENASGIWLLEKIDHNRTNLTYLWNGELSGNIPKVVLPRAWKSQGNEILKELEEALKNL